MEFSGNKRRFVKSKNGSKEWEEMFIKRKRRKCYGGENAPQPKKKRGDGWSIGSLMTQVKERIFWYNLDTAINSVHNVVFLARKDATDYYYMENTICLQNTKK